MSFEYQNYVSLPVNLGRQANGPLDISSVFLTEQDLRYYLSNGAEKEGVSEYWYTDENKYISPYPYDGQIIVTVFGGTPVAKILSQLPDGTYKAEELVDYTSIDQDLGTLGTEISNLKKALYGTENPDNTEDLSAVYVEIASLKDRIGVPEDENGNPTGVYQFLKEYDAEVQDKIDGVQTQIGNITKDYLTSADRDTLEGAIQKAVSDAKEEVLERILTGGEEGTVKEAYDTLKEVADWIDTDGEAAAALVNEFKTLKDVTLKGITDDVSELSGDLDKLNGDVLALSGEVDEVAGLIGTIPSTSGASTVVEYLQVLSGQYDEKFVSQSDFNTFKTDTNKELEEISGSVSTLEDTVGGISTRIDTEVLQAINDKVSKKTSEFEGSQVEWTLLSPENAKKLNALDFENGELVVSGSVSAYSVTKLDEWITDKKNTVKGLLSDEHEAILDSAIRGVQVLNKNGDAIELQRVGDGVISIPNATATIAGAVLSTAVETDDTGTITNPNTVEVKTDGTMAVAAIKASTLVQDEDEYIVMYGGNAKDLYEKGDN